MGGNSSKSNSSSKRQASTSNWSQPSTLIHYNTLPRRSPRKVLKPEWQPPTTPVALRCSNDNTSFNDKCWNCTPPERPYPYCMSPGTFIRSKEKKRQEKEDRKNQKPNQSNKKK